ncbi:MAG TPA: bL28 family ribosomal protein, partial [Anaerolineaceae bacterium]|nr:bL28 family ribosomal protein [Anaerolineaceae bacterium]
MAKCENCGKTTNFGHNRSHSLVATRREFRP